MRGYSVRDVARMLDVTPAQVRAYARQGVLNPQRGARRELRFSFQDLVVLQTAKALTTARVPASKVRRSLARLKHRLPTGRSLTGVRVAAVGREIVVRDGETLWNPESGQVLFDFDVADLARKAAPIALRTARQAREAHHGEMGAAEWYELACDLEPCSVEQARDAYRRAIELDPHHVDAHVNLGRLLHEAGEPRAAEAHYRLALDARPDDTTAWFNLGVALQDLGRRGDAIAAYRNALRYDGDLADAHYNLARLYERAGKKAAAIRHLAAYRRLTT